MKKSKLIAGLSAAFVGLIALASCSGSVTSAGDVLLYYNGKGYTAEELFNEKISTSEGAQAAFNAVYKVAVRNWANSQDSGLKREIENETKNKVSSAKADAQSNASKNGTSYDTEFKKILSSNGVDNETGLYNKFEYDIQKEKFEDKFYENNYEILKKGGYFNKFEGKIPSDPEEAKKFKERFYVDGYLNSKHPYHMKHILVKLTESANYKQETITAKNAKDIAAVITTLAKGDTSFGNVARSFQEIGDSGSAKELGSVGIMDVDTSFVDEFKLGTYIYECFFGHATQVNHEYKETGTTNEPYETVIAKDKLFEGNNYARGLAEGISNYDDPSSAKTGTSQGIGTIPYEAALKLKEWSDVEFTQKFLDATGGTKNDKFLPRNVLFNKYFNRHNICVITPNKLNKVDSNHIYKGAGITSDYWIDGKSGSQKRYKQEQYIGNNAYSGATEEYQEYKDLKGFSGTKIKNNDYLAKGNNNIEIVDDTNSVTNSTNFLRDTDGRIIFVVRGKDGLHFIVVERSPFVYREKGPNEPSSVFGEEKSGVTREEYFSTAYPGEPNVSYPSYDEDTVKQTFVTYSYERETVKYKSLAKTVKDKLKSSDANLNKRIYRYLLEEGKFQFVGKGEIVKNSIENWIDRSVNYSKYEQTDKWNKSWEDYASKLGAQKERRKEIINSGTETYYTSELVPEVCAYAMGTAKLDSATSSTNYIGTDDLTALFGPGGIFYEQASK